MDYDFRLELVAEGEEYDLKGEYEFLVKEAGAIVEVHCRRSPEKSGSPELIASIYKRDGDINIMPHSNYYISHWDSYPLIKQNIDKFF